MPPFQDHFSERADRYATYRPDYPVELFSYLASLIDRHELAWDCGTGNGQAAVGLAAHFAWAVGTDPSRRQIANRRVHDRVRYVVAAAEQVPLRARAVDLVAVAQALHWFAIDPFFVEVRRVVRAGGLVAVWCYSRVRIGPALDPLLSRLYDEVVGPYWPNGRHLVNTGYRTVRFPFEELETPPFTVSARYTLDDFLGYVGTWSATRRYRLDRGADPIDEIREALTDAWGPRAARRTVTWPLHLRVGRVA